MNTSAVKQALSEANEAAWQDICSRAAWICGVRDAALHAYLEAATSGASFSRHVTFYDAVQA